MKRKHYRSEYFFYTPFVSYVFFTFYKNLRVFYNQSKHDANNIRETNDG